jgi:predicted nucleotidyltransferase
MNLLNRKNSSLKRRTRKKKKKFSKAELISIIYHNIFNYPLKLAELEKWEASKDLLTLKKNVQVESKDGYFFPKGKQNLIRRRKSREKISAKKIKLAKKAARILASIPQIKMIGITGSLAMRNSEKDSDIDLIIVTSPNTLWTSRLFAYFLLNISRILVRRVGEKRQKDRLCLNMWLDESSLSWDKKDRNIYTAHEIGQIVPIVNKSRSYENLLFSNKWIKEYWPNLINKLQRENIKIRSDVIIGSLNWFIKLFIETIAWRMQYFYMKSRITSEIVGRNKAIFHPLDFGETVLSRLKRYHNDV